MHSEFLQKIKDEKDEMKQLIAAKDHMAKWQRREPN